MRHFTQEMKEVKSSNVDEGIIVGEIARKILYDIQQKGVR